MNDQAQDWDIGRQGRRWTGPEGLAKLERLPGRLELVHGKLCFYELERRTLLAGLMENMGLDEVVQFGKLEDWQQAIAARVEGAAKPPTPATTEVPAKHWNCRVIEFPSDEETWCAIHEVYYENGTPVAYSSSPAAPGWTTDDGPAAGLDRLEKFREALRKPVLKVSAFEHVGDKATLLDKLGRMIEDSGGDLDWPALSAWLEAWLAEPLPELNGVAPAQMLGSEDGLRQLEALIERMRRGLPGWRPSRRIGQMHGELTVPEDFDAPLPSEVLQTFDGSPLLLPSAVEHAEAKAALLDKLCEMADESGSSPPAFTSPIDIEPALRRMHQLGLDDGDIGYAYWYSVAKLVKAAASLEARVLELEAEVASLRKAKHGRRSGT